MNTSEAIKSEFLDRDSLLTQIAKRDEKIIHLDQKSVSRRTACVV